MTDLNTIRRLAGLEEQYVGKDATYKITEAKDGESASKVVIAALTHAWTSTVDQWEDAKKRGAKDDMMRMYRGDAKDWKNILDFAREGNHNAAIKTYSSMDTGSRDNLSGHDMNKASRDAVAKYFGFEWNARMFGESYYEDEEDMYCAVCGNTGYRLDSKDEPCPNCKEKAEQEDEEEKMDKYGGGAAPDDDDPFNDRMDMDFTPGKEGKYRKSADNPYGTEGNGYDDSRLDHEDEEVAKFKTTLSKGQHVEYKGDTFQVAVPNGPADFVGIVPMGTDLDSDHSVDMVRASKLMNKEDEEAVMMDVKVSEDEETAVKYGVFATGGSIGSKTDEPWKVFDDKEDAKDYAKRMRKQLSKGERSYYKMGYSVRPIKTEDEEFNPDHEPDTNICPDCMEQGGEPDPNCERCGGAGEIFESEDDEMNRSGYHRQQASKSRDARREAEKDSDDKLFWVRVGGNFWGGKYYEDGIDSIVVSAKSKEEAHDIAIDNKKAVVAHFHEKRLGSQKRRALKTTNNNVKITKTIKAYGGNSFHKTLTRDGKFVSVKLKEGANKMNEGRMPASVIKSKVRYAEMNDEEFVKNFGDRDEERMRQMAWRHGYGKMSPHYWNRLQQAKKNLGEGKIFESASDRTSYKIGNQLAKTTKHIKSEDEFMGLVNNILKRMFDNPVVVGNMMNDEDFIPDTMQEYKYAGGKLTDPMYVKESASDRTSDKIGKQIAKTTKHVKSEQEFMGLVNNILKGMFDKPIVVRNMMNDEDFIPDTMQAYKYAGGKLSDPMYVKEMKITTNKFGTHEIDLKPHRRKKGLNNVVNSIIGELKLKTKTARVSEPDRAKLHVEIRKQLLEAAQEATVWDAMDHDKDESPESPKDSAGTIKVPANVKSALKKEIKELNVEAKKIESRDNDRAVFYTNTADAMQEVLNHLEKGTVDGLKRAQVCITKYMSPIVQRFPDVAYDFVTGGGEPKSLKDLFKKVKAKK